MDFLRARRITLTAETAADAVAALGISNYHGDDHAVSFTYPGSVDTLVKTLANYSISTALPYEIGVLKRFVSPLIENLPRNVPCRDQVDGIRRLLKDVPKLNPALVPEGSILREFIGPKPAPKEA